MPSTAPPPPASAPPPAACFVVSPCRKIGYRSPATPAMLVPRVGYICWMPASTLPPNTIASWPARPMPAAFSAALRSSETSDVTDMWQPRCCGWDAWTVMYERTMSGARVPLHLGQLHPPAHVEPDALGLEP